MIRIGIIGAGNNGAGNARRLAAHSDRCKVVAVADPQAELASRLADELGAKAVSDMAGFLDDVDAAVVSSPNFLHAEQAVALAEAGKHIFVEKPMALSTADADRMAAAVEKAGVASIVGFSVRFDATVQAMVKLYREGALGEMISVFSRRCTYSRRRPDSNHWRASYELSGGLMSELLAHEIDWEVDAAGLPRQVYCHVTSRAKDHPAANDHVWMTMIFGDDCAGTIEGSMMAPMADYYRGIIGTEASAYTTEWGQKLMLQRAGEKTCEEVALAGTFDKHGAFLDAIEGKAESPCDIAWGRNIVYITEQALVSAVEHRAVDLAW